MGENTKNKFLDAALEMFSKNGYAGTNIRELSASLGMGKSSLYRHFESKEEIWNEMIDGMESYYEEHFGSQNNMPKIPKSLEELKTLTMKMLNFTLYDEKVIMMRKIMLTEQFRDERIREITTKHFNETLEDLFEKIFDGMIKNGSINGDNPSMMAFSYTAPISTLVQLNDREPNRREEILKKIESFIEYFINSYEENYER